MTIGLTGRRYAARKDGNHRQIAEALEQAGFEVYHTLPADILAWREDKGWVVIEAKMPGAGYSPAQKALQAEGKGRGILTARTPIAALKAAGAISGGYTHEQ